MPRPEKGPWTVYQLEGGGWPAGPRAQDAAVLPRKTTAPEPEAVVQKRLVMLNPMIRGSSVKTLVVRPVSSLLMKKPVIGVLSNRFLT